MSINLHSIAFFVEDIVWGRFTWGVWVLGHIKWEIYLEYFRQNEIGIWGCSGLSNFLKFVKRLSAQIWDLMQTWSKISNLSCYLKAKKITIVFTMTMSYEAHSIKKQLVGELQRHSKVTSGSRWKEMLLRMFMKQMCFLNVRGDGGWYLILTRNFW